MTSSRNIRSVRLRNQKMNSDSTYKEKFEILKPWMDLIVQDVKRDLKNEHLKKNASFVKTYFQTKNINKLTVPELVEGYLNALESSESAEAIAEFISNRWLLKNSDVYYYFEQKLQKVSENFSELTQLNAEFAKDLADGAVDSFGARKAYLFSVFNSVVFPEETFQELSVKADEEKKSEISKQGDLQEELSWAAKERAYELQIARLNEKFEKKLLGFQKKYDNDVSALKKQIASLQKKIVTLK